MKNPEKYKLDEIPIIINGESSTIKRYMVPFKGNRLKVMANDNEGSWEHASVTIKNNSRCPIWDEMCFIKDLFWHDEEIVIQFHPKKSQYVNAHPYCLHLWRRKDGALIYPYQEKINDRI